MVFRLGVVAEQAGAASLWLTTMSMSPSLSMSPKAAPRPTCLVSKYGPASRVARRNRLPLADVVEEQGDLFVVDRLADLAAVVVDVAVDEEDVGPAVVVEVGERTAPVDPGHRVGRQAEEGGVVEEDPFAIVLVEGGVLVREVGDEQLGKAVAVDVLGVDPHARLGHAVDVEGSARELGDVVEGAVAAVQEQEVRVHVVGDEDVDQAVVVDVGRHHAEPVAVGARAWASRCGSPCHRRS